MNKKDEINAFLEELNKLTDKYGLEVTAEGTSPLLYDRENSEHVAEFGRDFFNEEYIVYRYE